MSEACTDAAGMAITGKAKFPINKLKKIVFKDEDIGKCPKKSFTTISFALECFIKDLTRSAAECAGYKGTNMVSATHLKRAINGHARFDVFKDYVKHVPDIDKTEERMKKKAKKEMEIEEEEEDEEEDAAGSYDDDPEAEWTPSSTNAKKSTTRKKKVSSSSEKVKKKPAVWPTKVWPTTKANNAAAAKPKKKMAVWPTKPAVATTTAKRPREDAEISNESETESVKKAKTETNQE